ncbi:putative tetratricopeptide-like helical domain superfamily, DYW domain-containing protein [Helianthus annuus]|nr:putative tetratricopeptide-like helical domain superfamily, DYW domain-containing protein [Helianthus annuus]KAJ0736982.1 putative tetratricopeptide-like helical domain superfamily, DYW domain-containing protein [Helianthus annuus]
MWVKLKPHLGQTWSALHAHVFKLLDPSECGQFVQASLISFYSKCGIASVCRYQKGAKVKANEFSFVALINACADLGTFSRGIWAHCYVVKNLKLNRFVVTSLIDLYVNCGFLEFARQVFDELPKKDVLCYNAMIRGFATHGYGHKAVDLFENMVSEGLSPDDVKMVVVMCACSHVGPVNKGHEFFCSMRVKYGLEPKVEHYGCLVDLLGRAERISEAMEVLHTMPTKPNSVIWRSLLGATRIHGNLDIAEQIKHTCDKVPGTSILEINGVFHEFLTADKTHPRSQEVYLKIDEMNKKLHEYGHKPRTMEVLFDLEDEDGEDAFALIASELGSPIRIIKNLRVCVDCHDYTKLVSIIYKRDISVKRSESISLFSRCELFLFRLLVANCNAIRWLKNVDCATRRICTIRFIHVVLFFFSLVFYGYGL